MTHHLLRVAIERGAAGCVIGRRLGVQVRRKRDFCIDRQSAPAGEFYEIPYRSIRARGMSNLLVASRCIDCSHEAHAAIRVTSQIVAIGEGAGTAAGLCFKLGLKSTRDLDVQKLRETLRASGAFI